MRNIHTKLQDLQRCGPQNLAGNRVGRIGGPLLFLSAVQRRAHLYAGTA